MNKKLFFVLALSLVMSASIFAAGNSYKVKQVKGKVTYEATPGNWKSVSVGQELSASTVLNTSLNSSLVLTLDDDDITIKAMQKGTVDNLVASASGTAKVGAKKGLKSSSVAGEVSGKSKGTATASSRASEAKEDVDWDE